MWLFVLGLAACCFLFLASVVKDQGNTIQKPGWLNRSKVLPSEWHCCLTQNLTFLHAADEIVLIPSEEYVNTENLDTSDSGWDVKGGKAEVTHFRYLHTKSFINLVYRIHLKVSRVK